MRDALSAMFLQFAASGPEVNLSPPSKKTTLLGKHADELPTPSPGSKSKKQALLDPNKKKLKELDKNLSSHEAAVKKGISDLDKATLAFREAEEARVEMQKRLADRLERKRRLSEEATERGRRRQLLRQTFGLFCGLNSTTFNSY